MVAAGALLAGTGRAAEPPESEGAAALPTITVYRTPFCGCCTKWVDHLQHSSLAVDVVMLEETASVRSRAGVCRDVFKPQKGLLSIVPALFVDLPDCGYNVALALE